MNGYKYIHFKDGKYRLRGRRIIIAELAPLVLCHSEPIKTLMEDYIVSEGQAEEVVKFVTENPQLIKEYEEMVIKRLETTNA